MMGFRMQVALIALVLVMVPYRVQGQLNLYYGYTPGELNEFIAGTVSVKLPSLNVAELWHYRRRGSWWRR